MSKVTIFLLPAVAFVLMVALAFTLAGALVLVIALAMIWWLSCSLTNAVFVRPEELEVLSSFKDSLRNDGNSKRIVVVCSSFDAIQEGLDEFLAEWKRREYRLEDEKHGPEVSKEFFPYAIQWSHDLIADNILAENMAYKLERRISNGQSILVIADVVPTFRLSQVIEHAQKGSKEISTYYRLGSVLGRFTAYKFKDSNPCDGNEYAVAREARFASQWLASTEAERVQLYALARGGFVNQRGVAVLSSLINRGLVKIEDGERMDLADPAFGDYIRNSLVHDELKAWQRQGHGSIWEKIWPPLTAIAVLALLFFLNANPEALAVLVALLGASLGTAPIAISLARSWRGPGQSDSAD